MTMLDQGDVFEHIRDQVETITGRRCFLADVPREIIPRPFSILYPIGVSLRPTAPLEDEPMFRTQVQVTAVGRSSTDSQWLSGEVDKALQSMALPAGASGMYLEQTVSPIDGPSEGVTSTVTRYNIHLGKA